MSAPTAPVNIPPSTSSLSGTRPQKRVAIFIVAYNAASTLRKVLDRIPLEVWNKVEEVFVFDDESQDDTYLVGMGYKTLHGKAKLSVFRNEKNLGYGGNQIRGYQYAISQGYDIVALLHGDGQYAPEALPMLLEPLEKGEADAVFGSRMMTKGAALKGGMPLYKYFGNKTLTAIENTMLGMSLSEFHSGYRLYSCHALAQLPFDKNTHEFHFDTQIIIQMHAAGMRIVEKPIPTFYGDEICHVNGMKYAKDVVKSVFEFELHKLGVHPRAEYELRQRYGMKRSPFSSHAQLLRLVGPQPRSILDFSNSHEDLHERLRDAGHDVSTYGVDEPSQADGSPRTYEIILLSEVLEHVADPARVLKQAKAHLAQGGRMLVALPNAVHWSVRAQVTLGRLEYADQGIMNREHLRFFTQASAIRMFDACGLRALSHHTTPIPWEDVLPPVVGGFVRDKVEKADSLLGRLSPNAFAYQHLFELELDPRAAERFIRTPKPTEPVQTGAEEPSTKPPKTPRRPLPGH